MKFRAQKLLAAVLCCAMVMAVAAAPAAAAQFSDVPAAHWAAAAVSRASELGLLSGQEDGSFGLGRPMTRGAFVVSLCRLMEWDTGNPPAKGSFTDNQDVSAWYYAAVETAVVNGAVTKQETDFRPDDPITREEIAVMLVRGLGYGPIAGLSMGLTSPFTDVSSNAGYLAMAQRLGLMNGVSAQTFDPQKEATREQAAAILVRVYDKLHTPVAVCGLAASPDALTLNGVDVVAIPALNMTYSGEVKLSDALNAETVAAIRQAAAGKQQLLCISASAISMQSGAPELADDIAKLVADGQWDGVMLDAAKLDGNQRTVLTALVTAVRAALEEGKQLYVVAEAPSWKEKAYRGYDFAALAAQADQIILRVASYSEIISDFPTAPLEPLEQLYYALATLNGAIPAEKLSLWLTSSGVKWLGTSGLGSLSPAETATLHRSTNTTKYWSARYGSSYLCRMENKARAVVWYNAGDAAAVKCNMLRCFGGAAVCISDLSGPLDKNGGILTGLK